MIWDMLVYYRRQRPQAPAVLLSGGAIGFGRLAGDVARVTQALREQLPAGTRFAGIDVRGGYLHWLCILALMRLRVTSASLSPEFSVEIYAPDVVIADRAVAAGVPVILATTAWLERTIDATDFADKEDPADFPMRMTASSGTTGRPKRILLGSNLVDQRLISNGVTMGFAPDTRLVTHMGLATLGGFQLPLSAWMRGGMVALAKNAMADPALSPRLRPNLVITSTGHLERMLGEVRGEGHAFPGVRFLVGGSAVAAPVMARARQLLSSEVEILYGSTEMNVVTVSGTGELAPYSVGHPLPFVELEVVDDEGRPVAAGKAGEVRMRSPFGVDGYEDDPEATAAVFRDGWFYPGDLAALGQDGQLRIVGRTSEVFNLGGRKISPETIDEATLACPGVLEAASCLVKVEGGAPAVAIGVKAGEAYSREDVERTIRQKLDLPRFLVVELAELPRNEMGKIRRNRLAEAIVAARTAAVPAG